MCSRASVCARFSPVISHRPIGCQITQQISVLLGVSNISACCSHLYQKQTCPNTTGDQGCRAVAFWGGSGAGLNFHGSGSYFTVWGPSVISDFACFFLARRIFSCLKNSVVDPQHSFLNIIWRKIFENYTIFSYWRSVEDLRSRSRGKMTAPAPAKKGRLWRLRLRNPVTGHRFFCG